MANQYHLLPKDLAALNQLVADGIVGMTDVVEAMHCAISPAQSLRSTPSTNASGITGLVYHSVRGVSRLVAGAINVLAHPIARYLPEPASSYQREAVVAAMNGVLGDHLDATGNSLAITMQLRANGVVISDFAGLNDHLMVFIHGLCMNDLAWPRDTHCAALAAACGASPLYLHYNTGRHISSNGQAFASLLEALTKHGRPPVKRITLVGHSMGGLVARSAVYAARVQAFIWPELLSNMVFLGTPHHGAPLERGGNWIDLLLGRFAYTAPLARLGQLRSAGITDLRHGNLLDVDWQGAGRFEHAHDQRQPVPLPEGADCVAIAATLGRENSPDLYHLPGDGLVQIDSALGRHTDPTRHLAIADDHCRLFYGMNHFELMRDERVFGWITDYLTQQHAERFCSN
ncbi:GPI inositol-deacylase [Burkholderiaceae bacterium DAT-1]|nr:GPI inositol-deacylase [Burkholderiaceae bacterium DAT-1]